VGFPQPHWICLPASSAISDRYQGSHKTVGILTIWKGEEGTVIYIYIYTERKEQLSTPLNLLGERKRCRFLHIANRLIDGEENKAADGERLFGDFF
jgi:hypothetical protein